MKNLINKNQSIYKFNLLFNSELQDLKNMLEDFDNFDEDEFNDIVYGKDGLLENQIYKIYVVVDWGARTIISIIPR